MNDNILLNNNKVMVCSLCGGYKEASEFYYNKTHRRYQSQCKSCTNRRSQERRAKFRDENRKEYLKRRREYNYETREKRNEYRKKYYRNNKQEEYMRYLQRRHRVKGLRLDFDERDWINCVDYFDAKCAYCGSSNQLTKDHFIPVNKKGNYTVDNIVPACRSCNCSKKDDDFLEWYQKQDFYCEERKTKILGYLSLMKR